MRKVLACAVAILLLSAVAVVAAEFWEKKSYTAWSEKECRKLLTDSPWASRHTLRGQGNLPGIPDARPAGAISNDTADPENPPEEVADRVVESGPQVTYYVQLRSARLMREAMVRQAQLRQNYAGMTAEQKRVFDQQAEQFLNRDFGDSVVVYVTYAGGGGADLGGLQKHWKSQTADTLKDTVFLNATEGVKAPLLQYTPGEGDALAFQFVFPRQVGGKPLVTAKDKRLQLEFVHPGIGELGEKRILVEFKPNKMLVKGQLQY